MPIGVFDSGLGGLTVLGALQRRFPDRAFTYFGDTANAPYGTRAARDIVDLTIAGVSLLFGQGCELVILACNTASAVALRPMQEYFVPADRRVLGVLVPMVEAVAGRAWHDRSPPRAAPMDRVLFFGTPATVASGAFPREVGLRARGVDIVQVACPGLVDALEAGDVAQVSALVDRFAAEGLAAMPAPQAAVLGCTHYPLAGSDFARALPARTEILPQGALAAESLAAYLARHPGLAGDRGPTRYLTSGDPEAVTAAVLRVAGRAGMTFQRT